MFKFSKLGLSAAVLAAGMLMGAGSASAVPVVNAGVTTNMVDGSTIEFSISDFQGGDTFADVNFTVLENGTLNIVAGGEVSSKNYQDVTLTGLTLIADPAGAATVVGSGSGSVTNTQIGLDFFSGSWSNLMAGVQYALRLTFTVNKTPTDNQVDGIITFGVVPIPSALVLFGSGIAGLGLLARRRKSKANSFAAV